MIHGNEEKTILNYVEKGEGTDLLFFHGLGMSADPYSQTIDELAKSFRVIAPHLRRFDNLKQVEDEISLIIEKAKIKKAVVIGHSAGGIVAYNFAKQHPENTKSLILVNSAGVRLKGNIYYLLTKTFKSMLNMFIRNRKVFASTVKDFLFSLTNPQVLDSSARFIANYSIEECDLDVPVLIIHGKEDLLIPVSHAIKLNSLIKNSKLELVEGDHLWIKNNPEMFAQKVREFTQ